MATQGDRRLQGARAPVNTIALGGRSFSDSSRFPLRLHQSRDLMRLDEFTSKKETSDLSNVLQRSEARDG